MKPAHQKTYTVADIAKIHKKTTGRIRQIALEYEIGTCYGNRIRLFSKPDADKIAAIISESGRNCKNSEFSC